VTSLSRTTRSQIRSPLSEYYLKRNFQNNLKNYYRVPNVTTTNTLLLLLLLLLSLILLLLLLQVPLLMLLLLLLGAGIA
jgi:hypothetical protein